MQLFTETDLANDNNSNIAVAVDGTWHKEAILHNGAMCHVCLLSKRKGLSTLKLSQNIVLHRRTYWKSAFMEEHNPNESFNKCIWERIPKTVFVGIETLKFGVMDAVICFNDGYVSRIKVFEALGIKPGYNTERALLIIDNKRIFEAERIVNKVSLEARNKRRSLKRKMDKQNLDEENEYQAGKY
ncbi:uncharacterized protein TNCV_2012141 [Trichonephila clavipes]|nr:uncharacterized protein TNCV_2012141 [Trichonephila clavipes]